MTVVSIQTQTPSLQFDGNTVTLGDQSFNLSDVRDFQVEVKGGLITGFEVEYRLTTADRQVHSVRTSRTDARANKPTVVALQEAIEAYRKAHVRDGAVLGTIRAGGTVFRAERRQDGSIYYWRRQDSAPKRVPSRNFIPDDAPDARPIPTR